MIFNNKILKINKTTKKYKKSIKINKIDLLIKLNMK